MLPEELEGKLPDKSHILLEKSDWDPAIFWTNENALSKPLLEKIRAQFEPSYLIGIGSGNLWSHLPAFPNSEPKGVISIDASESVVSGLRLVRDLLRLYPTRKGFLQGIRDFSEGQNPPDKLDPRIKAYLPAFLYYKGNAIVTRPHTKLTDYDDPLHEARIAVWDSTGVEFVPSYTEGPDIPGFILQNYEIFRKLAIEGRIGVIRRDIRDKEFLNQVPNLDQYGLRNHVVYLSNAFDHRNYRWASEFNRETMRPVGGSLVYSLLGSRWNLEMYVEDKTGSIEKFS